MENPKIPGVTPPHQDVKSKRKLILGGIVATLLLVAIVLGVSSNFFGAFKPFKDLKSSSSIKDKGEFLDKLLEEEEEEVLVEEEEEEEVVAEEEEEEEVVVEEAFSIDDVCTDYEVYSDDNIFCFDNNCHYTSEGSTYCVSEYCDDTTPYFTRSYDRFYCDTDTCYYDLENPGEYDTSGYASGCKYADYEFWSVYCTRYDLISEDEIYCHSDVCTYYSDGTSECTVIEDEPTTSESSSGTGSTSESSSGTGSYDGGGSSGTGSSGSGS